VSNAVPGPANTAGTAVSYPLYAGGGGDSPGTQVGTVSVWSTISGNIATLHITYNLTTGCLNETHLQVALSTGGVPQKNGNPVPGQFDNSHTISQASCITTDSYTVVIDVGTDNAVVIAAHAVVRGTSVSVPAADWVSGPTAGAGIITGNVVNRRPGTQVGFTAVNTPLVAAWEPNNNVDPSFWDQVINLDPSGNGAYLLNHGADWVWESFRVQDPIQGTVIQADMTVTIPSATAGTFRITCDNGYALYVNGIKVAGGDGATAGFVTQLSDPFAAALATNTNLKQVNVSGDGWQTVEAYNVNLNAGANVFTLYGVNEYMNTDDTHPGFAGFGGVGIRAAGADPVGTIDLNPAGCIFGLHTNAVLSGEETAWGAPNGFTGATTGTTELGGNFTGKNWATYFTYQVR
jgi:hypothetical protein